MFRTSAGSGRHIPRLEGPAQGMLVLFALSFGCTGEPSPRPSDPAPPQIDLDPFAFPSQPIAEGPVPKDVARRFAELAEGDAGVCLVEPPDGALFPRDGLPPRVRFQPLANEDLWQITLSSVLEDHDLVVYTMRPQWTMDPVMWESLGKHVAGKAPIDVTVRGLDVDGGNTLSVAKASFQIAPVEAGGTIVYWAADGFYNAGGETKLVGFRFGELQTIDTLKPEDVQETPTLDEYGDPKWEEGEDASLTGRVRCIGCHASTPDGDAVAFSDNWPWNSVVASIQEGSVGQRPSYVSQAATRVLQQPWQGAPTFSKLHWTQHHYIMVQSFAGELPGWIEDRSQGNLPNDDGRDRLIWFNLDFPEPAALPDSGPDLHDAMEPLEGTAFGFIARDGDPRGAVNPAWSHITDEIAYVSASRTLDGHSGGSVGETVETDIYVVPFNEGRGGEATPLRDAAEPGVLEYYPDYSADDEWIAFTRAESAEGPVYYRPDGEIWIVHSEGGRLQRLEANRPPQCTGETSPGVINSWPKWSPTVQVGEDGKRYYWLIFSSARAYVGQFLLRPDVFSPEDTRSSQLYIAPIVVDGDQVTTYPAIYLYNQTTNTTNLTPAWDEFLIPDNDPH